MVVRLRPAHLLVLLCILTASLTPLSAPQAALAAGLPGSSTGRTPTIARLHTDHSSSGPASAGVVTGTAPAATMTLPALTATATVTPAPTLTPPSPTAVPTLPSPTGTPSATATTADTTTPVPDGTTTATASPSASVTPISVCDPSTPTARVTTTGRRHDTDRAQATATDQADPTATTPISLYGHLPLSFEANLGQTDPAVSYLARGAGYSLFLTAAGATLVLAQPQTTTLTAAGPAPYSGTGTGAPSPTPCAGPIGESALQLSFVGANPAAPVVAQDPLPGTVNSFLGNDPQGWTTNIPTYGQVAYQGIYPGIDLLYDGTQGRLEYTWQVAPGADPSQIVLHIAGSQSLSVDAQGALQFLTAAGPAQQDPPDAYQTINGQRQSVPVSYTLLGPDTVGLSLGAYDPSQPLTIDPVLSYASYLEGNGTTYGLSIAVDGQGDAFITGATAATNYITSSNAYSTTPAGGFDTFVTKLNPAGNAVLYSTYLGGGGTDVAYHLAVDSSGDAYVGGYTSSRDFPTRNAMQSIYGGDPFDGYVVKLNPSGSQLLFSTYLGGNGEDEVYGLTLDSSANVYVTGRTASTTFITTTGTLSGALDGSQDAFVTKLTSSGALSYSTYFGGSSEEYGDSIVVDTNHDVYITGDTISTDLHIVGGFDTAEGGNGYDDGFMAELNPTASSLLYSTYLGGGGIDLGTGIALDSAGRVYVTGGSRDFYLGPVFPTTPGVVQPGHRGGEDAFVTKIDPSKTGSPSLVWSTFLGGFGDDRAYGIAVDSAGHAFVTGVSDQYTAYSWPFPFVDPLAGVTDLDNATFVAELAPDASALIYSTPVVPMGANCTTPTLGIALDASGAVYNTGITTLDALPLAGALESAPPAVLSGYVAKILPLGGGGTVPWHPHNDISLAAGLDLSVDLADGHVDLGLSDPHIPGRGPDITVNKTWDSAIAQTGLTAGTLGWTTSVTPSMGGALTSTVLYTDSTGAVWPFRYTGSLSAPPPYAAYATPPGLPWQLYTSSSGYELQNILTGELLLFDTQGRFVEDEDSYGNNNAITFGTAGPNAVTNSGGRIVRLYYTSAGQLNGVQSPLAYNTSNAKGQLVATGYNGAGYPTSESWGYGTSDQVSAAFGYTGAQLTSVTVGIGVGSTARTWTLGYDSAGRLSTVTSPVSGTQGQIGYTPAYTTQVTYLPGTFNGVTNIQPRSQVVDGYGTSGALTTTYTLDSWGEPISTTDGLSTSTSAFYDVDHDVITSTDQNNNSTINYYQYVGPNSSTGLITETVEPPIQPYSPLNGGLDQPTITHTYNLATNDLIATDLPEGGKELYGYDGHHSVVSSTELLNSSTNTWRGTINAYDGYGELTAVTDGRGVSVNSSGVASLAPSASQYTAHTTYTTQGDVQTEGTAPITTTLNGTLQVNTPVTTTYGYDADGNKTGLISPNGQVTGYGYDHLGRLTTTALPQVTLYTGQNVYPTETTGYDGEGNVITQTDGNGDATLDSFEPLGRLIAETNPVSGTTVYTYNATEQTAVRDPMGNPTSYQYDAAGRVITETDPATGTVQYAYDAAGNTTAITTGSPSGAVQTQQLQYDALDRVLTQTVGGPGLVPVTTTTRYDHDGNVFQVQQPNGDVTINTYDFANQLLSTEVDPAPVNGATHGQQESYSYDAAGNLMASMDMDGRISATTYDGGNRQVQSVAATTAPTGTTTITTSLSYDPDSNVLTRTSQTVDTTSPGVVATHTYTATYNADDWQSSSADDGLVTQDTQDGAGRQRTATLLGGQGTLTTVLDPRGRATAIGENIGGTGPYTSTFGYTADDRPQTINLPGAVQESAQYDVNDRLAHLGAAGPNTGVVTTTLSSGYDYAYNPNGWMTAVTSTLNNAVTSTQFMHNALGRLTQWTGQLHGPESWGYDANGNLTSNSEYIDNQVRTTVFTYSQSITNQLAVQHTDGFGYEYYSYDKNGDTTSLTSTDALGSGHYVNIHLTYDAAERPITVTTYQGTIPITVSMGYNAAGQRDRYTVTMSGTTTLDERMQYRDGELAQVAAVTATLNGAGQVTSSGAYTDTYVWGGLDEPLEFVRQQNGQFSRYFYVLDGQGNVVAVTDVNGHIVDRYAYDPWGEGLPEGTYETLAQPLRYRGYWWDSELGWYWLDTRSYDPEGRFLQPDPTALDGVLTYVYADDDPVDLMEVGGASILSDLFHAAVDFVGNALHVVYTIAETTWDFVAGDDIHAICCTNEPIYQKMLAGVDLALTVLPGADVTKLVEVGVKAAGRVAAERSAIDLVRGVIGRTAGRINVDDGTIAEAISGEANALRFVSRSEAAIDANILVRAIDRNELTRLDEALGQRYPVIPPEAEREYLNNPTARQEDVDALLELFGGRRGVRPSAVQLHALWRLIDALNATLPRSQQRVIGASDALVVVSALMERLPLLTNDRPLASLLRQLGLPLLRW